MTTTGRADAVRRALQNEFEPFLEHPPHRPDVFWDGAVASVIRAIDGAVMDGAERLARAADLLPGLTPNIIDGWYDQWMSHDDPAMPGRLVWAPADVADALAIMPWERTTASVTVPPDADTATITFSPPVVMQGAPFPGQPGRLQWVPDPEGDLADVILQFEVTVDVMTPEGDRVPVSFTVREELYLDPKEPLAAQVADLLRGLVPAVARHASTEARAIATGKQVTT